MKRVVRKIKTISFKKEVLYFLLFLVFLTGFFVYFISKEREIVIKDKGFNFIGQQENLANLDNEDKNEIDNITGLQCKNYKKRPYAVMLAADKVARPLSGISQADLVIEMPVITDGITRYMAFFKCEEPEKIGSIRSARHDFITLAKSFDAIYVHWGGSLFALERLARGEIDNIDALKNPYNVFYRDKSIRAPHNGFTSYKRIQNAVKKLGFREETTFSGYKHTEDKSVIDQSYRIFIPYPKPYDVYFKYMPISNSYLRYVNSFKEIDKNTNKQVEVKNVLVMEAVSKQIKDQYNDVQIEDQGKLVAYRNGEIIYGLWKRENDKYIFLDDDGKEISFVPGKIWISVVQPNEKPYIVR